MKDRIEETIISISDDDWDNVVDLVGIYDDDWEVIPAGERGKPNMLKFSGLDKSKIADLLKFNGVRLIKESRIGNQIEGAKMKDRIEEAIDKKLAIVEGSESKLTRHLTQFIKRDDTFMPSGPIQLVDNLEPFSYKIESTMQGPIFIKTEHSTDELYMFENSGMTKILAEIKKFWTLKDNFNKLGFMHNRGILMYGPPGTGKTCLVQQVSEAMAKQGDVIFYARSLHTTTEGLKAFREVEPTRRAVVVFEDMDEYIKHDERNMLQLLDGENSMDNILFLGSTNYIERFPPRLLRPGRFDKKVKIDYPPVEGRLTYLQHKIGHIEEADVIQSIAEKTAGFSFGHLRELILSTFAFNEPLEKVMEELKVKSYNTLPERESGVMESLLNQRNVIND